MRAVRRALILILVSVVPAVAQPTRSPEKHIGEGASPARPTSVSERSRLGLEFVSFDWGADTYLATGVSLMIFYAFAMQCMSTLAVVRRETRSWKWPVIQLVYMTGLAYVMSLLAFQLLK